MELKEIKELIAYHQVGLDQYRQHMAVSAQYFEEQTVRALEDLLIWSESRKKDSEAVEEAKRILHKRRTQEKTDGDP